VRRCWILLGSLGESTLAESGRAAGGRRRGSLLKDPGVKHTMQNKKCNLKDTPHGPHSIHKVFTQYSRMRPAKHRAQYGTACVGFAIGMVKKYSLSLRRTMEALASRGTPL